MSSLVFPAGSGETVQQRLVSETGKWIVARARRSLGESPSRVASLDAAGHAFLWFGAGDPDDRAKARRLAQDAIEAETVDALPDLLIGLSLARAFASSTWTEAFARRVVRYIESGAEKALSFDDSPRHAAAAGLALLGIDAAPERADPGRAARNLTRAERLCDDFFDENARRIGPQSIGDSAWALVCEAQLLFRHARKLARPDSFPETQVARLIRPYLLRAAPADRDDNGLFFAPLGGSRDIAPLPPGLLSLAAPHIPEPILARFYPDFRAVGPAFLAPYALAPYQNRTPAKAVKLAPPIELDHDDGLFIARSNASFSPEAFVATIAASTGEPGAVSPGAWRLHGFGTLWVGAAVVAGRTLESIVETGRKTSPTKVRRAQFDGGVGVFDLELPGVRRQIRIDFRGESGAPCIVTLRDTISASGDCVWRLHTGASRLTLDGNRFSLENGSGATLTGLLILPENAPISVRGSSLRLAVPPRERIVTAVFTIQKGRAPEISVDKNGVVRVGGKRAQ